MLALRATKHHNPDNSKLYIIFKRKGVIPLHTIQASKNLTLTEIQKDFNKHNSTIKGIVLSLHTK